MRKNRWSWMVEQVRFLAGMHCEAVPGSLDRVKVVNCHQHTHNTEYSDLPRIYWWNLITEDDMGSVKIYRVWFGDQRGSMTWKVFRCANPDNFIYTGKINDNNEWIPLQVGGDAPMDAEENGLGIVYLVLLNTLETVPPNVECFYVDALTALGANQLTLESLSSHWTLSLSQE